MTPHRDAVVIGKNRKRAFWSLAIVSFMLPISVILLILGLQPGRPDVAWALVLFGILGIAAFMLSAALIIRTMLAPWRLELRPQSMALFAPNYDLRVPWGSIVGIAVNEVNRKPGCVLVLEDPAAVAQAATFRLKDERRNAVTDAAMMQARMEASFDDNGYHLAIPGRLLELGPEALADLLTRARRGVLWQEEESVP